MNAIIAMMIKDYKLMLRDRLSLFFIFIFPLIFTVFFGSMYGGETVTPHIKIGINDQDKTTISQAFIADLNALDSITVMDVGTDTQKNDKAQLSDALKRNKIAAHLTLPQGFAKIYNTPLGNETLTVSLVTDPKQPEVNMILTGMLKETASKRFNQLLDMDALAKNAPVVIQGAIAVIKQNMPKQQSSQSSFTPISIIEEPMATNDNTPSSGFILTLAQSSIWICMGIVVAFVSFIGVEATSGNLLRLSLSPFTKIRFLVAKGLAVFFAQVALMSLFFFGTWIFAPFSPNVIGVAVCICTTAFAFSGVMLGVTALLDIHSESVASVVNSVFLILAMAGGAMIPLTFMPKWMLTISQFNPIYHAIYSLEAVTWRGLSLVDIMLSLSILFGIGFIGLGISIIKFNYVQAEKR